MPLILFSGDILPCTDASDRGMAQRPATIRGFNNAGREIMSVPVGRRFVLPTGTQREVFFSIALKYLKTPGYTRSGYPIELWAPAESVYAGVYSPYPLPREFRATRCAMDQNGHVYAASRAIDGVMVKDEDRETIGQTPIDEIDFHTDWLRVFRRDGDRVEFPQLHGAQIRDIKIDASGNIFVAGARHYLDGAYLRKYDAAGALIWSVAAADPYYYVSQGVYLFEHVENMHFDASGNLYLHGAMPYGGAAGSRHFVSKVDASGAVLWKWSNYDGKGTIRDIDDMAVESDGSAIYTGGFWFFPDGSAYYCSLVQKRDPATGAVLAHGLNLLKSEFDAGGYPNRPVLRLIDGALHLFTKSNYTKFVDDHYVLDADDLSVVSQNHLDLYLLPLVVSGSAPDYWNTSGRYQSRDIIEVDDNGSVYACVWGHAGGVEKYRARLIDYAGSYLTEANPQPSADPTGNPWLDSVGDPLPISATCDYDVDNDIYLDGAYETVDSQYRAHVLVVNHPPIPGKALPIGVGLPDIIADTYTQSPPLPFALALADPLIRREYVGSLRLPDIYRLQLCAAWVPVSSVSVRRSAESATLTAIIPAATGPLIAIALAALTDGADLTLYRGVRFTDGTEQLEPMLSGPLVSARSDRGASNGALTLSATILALPIAPQARALKGISYINQVNGARRVRCAVDTFIQPGDTALLPGGESLLVSDMVYFISPAQGTLEVSE